MGQEICYVDYVNDINAISFGNPRKDGILIKGMIVATWWIWQERKEDFQEFVDT